MRALAPPGGAVVVESPTYRGALAAVRAAGLTPVPVPSDADGVRPAMLADALERTGARVAYLQPLHANPHGADLSAERRAEVMEIAARSGAFLIEDDWARDLTIDGPAPAPLAADDADGHVVYVRSLSKGASPGLRVAAVAARGPAGARLRAARIVEDLFVSAPLQHAALELVSSPGWRRHLKRAARRACASAATRSPARWPSTSAPTRSGACRPAGCTCGCGCRTAPTRTRLVAAAARAGVQRRRLPAELRGGADRPAPAADVRWRAAGRPRRGRRAARRAAALGVLELGTRRAHRRVRVRGLTRAAGEEAEERAERRADLGERLGQRAALAAGSRAA